MAMRWDNLSAPPDEGGSERAAPAAPPLPPALPGATIRTFDIPGFAGTTGLPGHSGSSPTDTGDLIANGMVSHNRFARNTRRPAGYSRWVRTAQQILADSAVIAVVGASRDPSKAAHRVPAQMQRYGWRIIPVNPTVDELFGERAYASLADIPHPVDLVDVFRPARDAVGVVREAVAIGAPAVWLQLGIVSPEARRIAEEAGIDYVEDRCLIVERAAAGLTRLP